jgi:ribosomal protein S18 acetylase RimI-like enzyme
VKLRPATPADVPVLLRFIRELAVFEREPDAVEMTEQRLHETLFGPAPYGEALLVELDGVPQATAIWGVCLNTWTGRPTLAVEDVYVSPACRGRGVGRAMFTHLARLAVERGYARMDWNVLDWNEPAIAFYEGLGAKPQRQWIKYRLAGADLAALAA